MLGQVPTSPRSIPKSKWGTFTPMTKLFKKILCPIDPSDNLTTSLDVACGLAEGADATIYLMYVVPVVLSSAPGVNPLPISESEARTALSKIAHAYLEGKVRYEIYTKVGGEPAAVILQAIKDLGVDSVVMPTHGRKGIGRLILGSVAERVVRESPHPVLTVRATPAK
jgi:nucleotide-binding universal stress UspA family protein